MLLSSHPIARVDSASEGLRDEAGRGPGPIDGKAFLRLGRQGHLSRVMRVDFVLGR